MWCVRESERVMKGNFQRLASPKKVLIWSESNEIAQSEAAFLEAAFARVERFFWMWWNNSNSCLRSIMMT